MSAPTMYWCTAVDTFRASHSLNSIWTLGLLRPNSNSEM